LFDSDIADDLATNIKNQIEEGKTDGIINLMKQVEAKTDIKFKMSDRDAHAIMDDMVNSSKTDGTNIIYNDKGSIGLKQSDISITKKRRNLEEWERQLMGEHTNPYVNFMKTTVKMASYAEKIKFEAELLATGLGHTLTENKGRWTTAQITAGQSVTLNGKWTTPEMHALMFGPEKNVWDVLSTKKAKEGKARTSADENALMQTIRFANAWTKASLTISKDDAQSRNFIGAALNLMWTGHLPRGMFNAIAVTTHDFTTAQKVAGSFMNPLFALAYAGAAIRMKTGKLNKEDIRNQMEEMVRLRLLDESIEANTIDSIVEGIYANDKSIKNIGKRGLKGYIETFSKPYQATDAIFKKIQFDREMKNLTNAKLVKEVRLNSEGNIDSRGKLTVVPLTVEEIKEKAATLVRTEQPTYSESPEYLKAVSKNLVVAPFVMFQAQVYRTRYNTLVNSRKLIRDAAEQESLGNTEGAKTLRNMSQKRYLGMAAMLSMTPVAAALSRALTEWSDDDDDKFSQLMPSYNKNQSRIYLSDNKKKPYFMDMSFIDPNSQFHKMWVAAGREDDMFDKMIAASGEFFNPFASEEIFFKRVQESWFNENGYGREIVPEGSTWGKHIAGRAAHASEVLIPGWVNTGKNLYKGLFGDSDVKSGKKHDWKDVLINSAFGLKAKGYDLSIAYSYKKTGLKVNIEEAVDSYKKGLGPKGNRWANSLETTENIIAEKIRILSADYKAMIDLGYSDQEIESAYKWKTPEGKEKEDYLGLKLLEHAKNDDPPKVDPETGKLLLYKAKSKKKPPYGKGISKPSRKKPSYGK
jgi:hypothetical protein